MTWLLLAYLTGFGAMALAGLSSYPLLVGRVRRTFAPRVQQASQQLEELFVTIPTQRLWWLYLGSPVATGALAWLFTRQPVLAVGGALLGFLLPPVVLRQVHTMRQKAFQGQLVDGLLLMSSSLRAGLSMSQMFGVVAEEMPPPISQEFGLLLKEMRMGVSLEEALAHLERRLPSAELTLFIATVRVARETGGDVTAVFAKLVDTLRERKKLRERVVTLTFMARFQGLIMAILPVVFISMTASIDKSHFLFFLQDPLGRLMLAGIVAMELVAIALFLRFARTPL